MIITATITNLQEITKLALKLWPEHDFDELEKEYQEIIQNENNAIFLCYDNNKPIGFCQCGLRFDYVEGTSTSPVLYLEAIYIEEEYRKQGYAKKLINRCIELGKSKNIKEFASDCEINNIDSYLFHLKLGFIEANRIICFTKKIDD